MVVCDQLTDPHFFFSEEFIIYLFKGHTLEIVQTIDDVELHVLPGLFVTASTSRIVYKMVPDSALSDSFFDPGFVISHPWFPLRCGPHPLFLAFSALAHVNNVGGVAVHFLLEFERATCCVACELGEFTRKCPARVTRPVARFVAS